MKKVGAFVCASIIVIVSIILISGNLHGKINKRYYDKMGDIVDYRKFQGLALQTVAASRPETLFLLGSSEVGGMRSMDPFHPINFFSNKKNGFQVDLIGRAYCQSLIHTINIGAMGNKLKGKKVVLIVSPQWFDVKGLTLTHLNVNFSEEQFYEFMFNKNISFELKKDVANRILKITSKGDKLNEVKEYCRLIVRNDYLHRLKLEAELPYFKERSYLLQLKDKIQALKLIDNANKRYFIEENSHKYVFNWNKELTTINKLPINNPYDFDNLMYSKVYSKEIKLMKRYTHHIAIDSSPEFGDFELLLSTFKEMGIKPLIIDLPMNGKWYDYCGIGQAERYRYYKKVQDIVAAYDFPFLDMSKDEYTKHGFKDSSHLEWKGLVYVDDAINRYYHQGIK